MAKQRIPSAHSHSAIAQLAIPRRIEDCGPIAARFVYSLRLIAVHERAGRDPVPELAARLGGVEVAAKAIALSQAIGSTWPENLQVSRFCCSLLTYDEATIADLLDAAVHRDRMAFEDAIVGLIRPTRMHRLWDAVFALVAAESRCT
ncbi:MAG: DNA-directed RNA polymerase subunit beta' [Erythrobacter sp.]|nr:DNA-directed RNA polymerase subunit beta' [Erythrobacter sp.]